MIMEAEEAVNIGVSVIQGKSVDQGKLEDLYSTLLTDCTQLIEPELIMLLGWVFDKESVKILQHLIRSESPSNSATAAIVLLQINFHQFFPEVIDKIETKSHEYQKAVQFCVKWHGGKMQELLGD